MNNQQIREHFLTLSEELTSLDFELSENEKKFVEARAVESELVDDYVLGRLSNDEREAFETHYLVTRARRERVARTRELATAAARLKAAGAESRSAHGFFSFWRLAPVMVGIAVIVIAGSYLYLYRPPVDVASVQVKEPAPPAPAVKRETPVAAPSVAPAPAVPEPTESVKAPVPEASKPPVRKRGLPLIATAVTLLPRNMRSDGSGETVISLNDGKKQAVLDLELEEAVRVLGDFAAEVKDLDGNTIHTARTAPDADGDHVRVTIPKGKLRPGTYIVYLTGKEKDNPREAAGEYVFKVVE